MLPTADVYCPYCGEPLQLLLDVETGTQAYVEDCQVCCRPINVTVTVEEDGRTQVDVASGDDV